MISLGACSLCMDHGRQGTEACALNTMAGLCSVCRGCADTVRGSEISRYMVGYLRGLYMRVGHDVWMG